MVNELACAARDAEALFALFADTFGPDGMVLLQDEAATRSGIVTQFEGGLTNVGEDDLVFISYAGHGSDDFFLVTHDADPTDLAATSVALDELVALFARIPSKRVVLVLDCCFSGGAGARVFHHALPKRSLDSVEAALARIADEGRIILTACDPSQEALEDPVEGHGMLTRHLLDALRGAPQVVTNGEIRFYDLLGYVTERVHDDAASVGHAQRPTFRGTIDGELKLPVFRAGAEFARRFPEQSALPVSAELEELTRHGIPSVMIEAIRAGIPSMNQLQMDAVNLHGVLAGRSLVISAPTSSGKTMVGELTALRGAASRRRALVLMPLKALVADKLADFQRRYGAIGLRILCATGDMSDDIPELLGGRYDICLMTYEKAAAMLLAFPHVLRGVGSIVVDEVQMLADPSRGASLEFLLTLLRDRRRQGVRPQLVLLSAVIGATNGLERWLGGSLLRSEIRPVPLAEGVLLQDGTFWYDDAHGLTKRDRLAWAPYGKGSAQDVLVPVVRKLVEDGESVVVFRVTKSETRRVAAYLARHLGLPPADDAVRSLPTTDLTAASTALRDVLRAGVAFHNSDLAREERTVVEEAFRAGDGVKVIVATTTLAMGINTPASTVLIVGLEHPGGSPYTVAEYKNMSGRAGRLGFSDRGKSMIVSMTPFDEHRAWSHYVKGQPEGLVSRFLDTDPATLICRVMATVDRAKAPSMSEVEILGFIESSFGAFQVASRLGPTTLGREVLAATLVRLEGGGLVESFGAAFRLTGLGRVAGENGVTVESVLRVAEALRGTPAVLMGDASLVAATQLTVELDSINFPVHKSSKQERERWQGALRAQRLPGRLLDALLRGDGATSRAKRAAAVLMWIQGKELGTIEAAMMKHLPRDDAAGAVRSVADRTRDLLPLTVRIVELLLEGGEHVMSERVDGLFVRLELGIPGVMVPFGKVAGTRLTRGDYLTLHGEGLHAAEDLAARVDADLEALLGSKAKLNVVREAQAKLEARAASTGDAGDAMPDLVDDVP